MADKLKIRPLHDRVIIKRTEEERTSPGGIVIPDSATEKPIKGKVIAVGKGKILENGNVRPLDIKAGDNILFGKYSGTEVKVDGEELLVMKEEDIMAVIEKCPNPGAVRSSDEHKTVRHPGEGRGPSERWIPTYVGMTKVEMFAGMTEEKKRIALTTHDFTTSRSPVYSI
jgi:chaperonin GroES